MAKIGLGQPRQVIDIWPGSESVKCVTCDNFFVYKTKYLNLRQRRIWPRKKKQTLTTFSLNSPTWKVAQEIKTLKLLKKRTNYEFYLHYFYHHRIIHTWNDFQIKSHNLTIFSLTSVLQYFKPATSGACNTIIIKK